MRRQLSPDLVKKNPRKNSRISKTSGMRQNCEDSSMEEVIGIF